MSFGEEATNDKNPKPNPNQTRVSRQCSSHIGRISKKPVQYMVRRQGSKSSWGEGWRVMLLKRSASSPTDCLTQCPWHSLWKPISSEPWIPVPAHPSSTAPTGQPTHWGAQDRLQPSTLPKARSMDKTEVIRATDAEDKGRLGKHPGEVGGARRLSGSEKAHGTVIKYGGDYRRVFRLWRNARERLWKTQLSWQSMRSFSFIFIFSFHAVLAGS